MRDDDDINQMPDDGGFLIHIDWYCDMVRRGMSGYPRSTERTNWCHSRGASSSLELEYGQDSLIARIELLSYLFLLLSPSRVIVRGICFSVWVFG